MDRLTPAERIDLKADMERTKALFRPGRRDAVSDILYEGRVFRPVHMEQAQEIQLILDRYPVLVELVRRLSEEDSQREQRRRDFGHIAYGPEKGR